MQYSSVFGLAAVLSLAQAAPLTARATGLVVFHGAADASYSVNVPLNGLETFTYNPLSVSSISSDAINIAKQCTLKAVDYTPALVEGPANTWVAGPPQTITSITCRGVFAGPSPASIAIEFDGADPSEGAKYSLTVPLDGSKIPTNNVLSISTLVSSFAGLVAKCDFEYVDHEAALVLIKDGALKTWAVGPPQTIKTVSCTA